DIVVVYGGLQGQTVNDCVIDGHTSAPCVSIDESVVAVVLNAGGDGEAVGCLEGVGRRDRPLSTVSVNVPTGGVDTSELQGARTDVSRYEGANCTFFVAEVVGTEKVEGSGAEGSRNDTFETEVLSASNGSNRSTRHRVNGSDSS